MEVEILRKICMTFRDIFIKETTIDPYARSLTIAGKITIFLKHHIVITKFF